MWRGQPARGGHAIPCLRRHLSEAGARPARVHWCGSRSAAVARRADGAAMHCLQSAQSKMGVDLGCGDVGMAQQSCTLRRSAPCSTIWVAQLWRRPCGLVEFRAFTSRQTHWRVSGMPRSERKRRRLRHCGRRAFCAVSDALQMRPAFAQILFHGVKGGAAERDDAFLVAFAAHLHASGVEHEIAGRKRGDFRNAQAAGVQKLQNGAIAESCGLVPADARRPWRRARASLPLRARRATWAEFSMPSAIRY